MRFVRTSLKSASKHFAVCVLLSSLGGHVSAQEGWVLYPPAPAPEGNATDGARYVSDLLRAYGDTFYVPTASDPSDPAFSQDQCIHRLKAAVQQIGHSLQGYSYDVAITLKGEVPPLAGVSCRMTARNDLSVTLEVKEN